MNEHSPFTLHLCLQIVGQVRIYTDASSPALPVFRFILISLNHPACLKTSWGCRGFQLRYAPLCIWVLLIRERLLAFSMIDLTLSRLMPVVI